MTPLPVTLNDLAGYFCCLKPFYLPYVGKYSAYYSMMFTWIGKHTWLVISTIF